VPYTLYTPAEEFSFEMEMAGPTCEWHWVVHAGVGLCTPVFGSKGGVWVGAVSVIPIFPANVGYARRGCRKGIVGWRMEMERRIVDGGGCKKRAVVMRHHICHPPNWAVRE
jgi:hypothetical protein